MAHEASPCPGPEATKSACTVETTPSDAIPQAAANNSMHAGRTQIQHPFFSSLARHGREKECTDE